MPAYIAAVQMNCAAGDMEENTRQVIRLFRQLMEKEPEVALVVFPEMALYGYAHLEYLKERYTQRDVEKNLKEVTEICRQYQVDAVIGAPFYGEDGIENAQYYLSREGDVRHVYSKVHLIEPERQFFRPGTTYGICQTSLGRLGFLICWDAGFPEAARLYAKSAVDLLVVSAAWEIPYEKQWELSICGRSFDNAVPVVAANRIGADAAFSFFGSSMITDCMGNIWSKEIGRQEGYVLAKWEDVSDRAKRKDFGSQIHELREDTYDMEHVRYYEIEKK